MHEMQPTTAMADANAAAPRQSYRETFSAILMISQEDGERVEIWALERELHATAQIEKGSIKEENFLKANHSHLT